MYCSDETISEIKKKINIVDAIGKITQLTKIGKYHLGKCPFHNDMAESLLVDEEKQLYYCFNCGASGDIINFVMEYNKLPFSLSIQMLAGEIVTTIPKTSDKEFRKKRNLITMNQISMETFQRNLPESIGYEYLEGRNITEHTMKKFGLGYARGNEETLYKKLNKYFKEDFIVQSGIFGKGRNEQFYNKFHDRIIYPIQNVNGVIVGFGGRIVGDGKPKYLNSQETPVFDKSSTLYGLNFAKDAKSRWMLLCEGYMDVISLHQEGFTNAVASLGTALTINQSILLKKYCDTVYLTYDSDQPGIKAAMRAIPILASVGIKTKIVNMEPYKDPDEFIKNLGKDAYLERIAQAEDSMPWIISKQILLNVDDRGKTIDQVSQLVEQYYMDGKSEQK